jgi:hypothetical protein
MKTFKNLAPSVLPIPVLESDEPLQSGQSFFMEEFVKIPFTDNYLINKLGQVYSVRSGKIISQWKNHKGYYTVTFWSKNKPKKHKIHSLLCLTFYDSEYLVKGLCVNHKDGNKLNNSLSNLEIVTFAENSSHASRTGLINNKGSQNKLAVLSEEDVADIFKSHNKIPQMDLALKYNVSKSCIQSIQYKHRWVHITDNL